MWISNTATSLMLLPVALAVLEKTEDPKLATPLLLGIAYAASLGGIGTPIGTPPNIVFMGVYEATTGENIPFLTWMTWAVPIVLVFLPVMGFYLTRGLTYRGRVELPVVGHWEKAEVRVLLVFALTAFFWITRQQPFGGWTALFELPGTNDAMVALLAVVVMFLVPDGKGGKLLDWETAERIPWGMLVLFGAGISIATAFTASGLSETIGAALSGIAHLHLLLLLLIICLAVTFLTETTSNTATTTLLMPILAAGALGAGIDPKLVMIPAAMSASCAFMLPVATAPNVIMFSTGKFSIETMAREGFALNLLGAGIIDRLLRAADLSARAPDLSARAARLSGPAVLPPASDRAVASSASELIHRQEKVGPSPFRIRKQNGERVLLIRIGGERGQIGIVESRRQAPIAFDTRSPDSFPPDNPQRSEARGAWPLACPHQLPPAPA